MKFLLKPTLVLALFLLIPAIASAQKDNFGTLDTVYADVQKIDDLNWSVTISYSNDQKVVGLSIPLKLSATDNYMVADSAIYTGGRTEHFAFKGFRPDTSVQCVTMGLIANLGPTNNTLEPGKGRVVTVFVSSIDDKPIETLVVDTTTTNPHNTLMMVAERFQGGDYPDSIPMENRRILEIRPAFVIRYSQ
jgi:hypothetical protein